LRCRQFPTVSGVSQGGGLKSYRLSSWKLLPKEFWISTITGQGPPDSRDLRVPGPTAPSDPHQSSARRPLRSHTGPRPRGPHRPVSGPTVPSAPDRSPARVHASSDAYCTLLIRCVGKSVWASPLIRQDFPPVDAWSIPHKLLKTRWPASCEARPPGATNTHRLHLRGGYSREWWGGGGGVLRRCHEAGASGTPGPGLPSVLWPASRVRGMARTKSAWPVRKVFYTVRKVL
jgi:hypothetical protein